MSFGARAGETAEELSDRVTAALTKGTVPEEIPLFTYEEYAEVPKDLSGGSALILSIATQSTPGVQMEAGAPFAVQGVEAGTLPDMADMLQSIPMPSIIAPPCEWIPIFPTLEEINPSNPEFAPTVEAVLRAFTEHQGTVMKTSSDGSEETVKKMKPFLDKRTPGYKPPNLLRRKGMGEGAFSAKFILMCTVADHRDIPDADKRPLVMYLGFAETEKEATQLARSYSLTNEFKHIVTGIPARTWVAPQLLYMRRMRPNDKFVSSSEVMQGVVDDQLSLLVRDETGKSFIEKLKDGSGEGGGSPDGSEAAESEEDAGPDAGADGASEAKAGGEGGSAGGSTEVASGSATE